MVKIIKLIKEIKKLWKKLITRIKIESITIHKKELLKKYSELQVDNYFYFLLNVYNGNNYDEYYYEDFYDSTRVVKVYLSDTDSDVERIDEIVNDVNFKKWFDVNANK